MTAFITRMKSRSTATCWTPWGTYPLDSGHVDDGPTATLRGRRAWLQRLAKRQGPPRPMWTVSSEKE